MTHVFTNLSESVSPIVYTFSDIIVNFSQNSDFSGKKTDSGNPYTDANGIGQWFYYQPPAGALALCTENLPVTPITAHLDEKPDYMKVTWT